MTADAGAQPSPAASSPAASASQDESPRSLSSILYGRRGFRIYSATVSGAYFQFDGPGGRFGGSLSGAQTAINAQASMGWSYAGERSSIALSYSPSYIAYPDAPELNSSSHMLSFSATRQLSQAWSFGSYASGQYTTIEQLMLNPTVYGRVAQLPATMDELANALFGNLITGQQLSSMLTGSPVSDATAQRLSFGTSILTASAGMSFTYSKSSRTSVTMSVSGARSQPVSGERPSGSADAILMNSTSANATLTLSYSLTPRTHVGVSTAASRNFGTLQDVYTGSTSGFIGRRMGRRWYAQAYGGGGYMRPVRQTYRLPSGPQYQAGGSIAVSLQDHTLIGSGSRTFGDQFGLGAGYSLTATGAWNWSPRYRAWVANASLSQNWFRQREPGNLTAMQATGSFGRALTNSLTLSLTYGYLVARRNMFFKNESHAATVSLTWAPRYRRPSSI